MTDEVASDQIFQKVSDILNGKLPASENECKEKGITVNEIGLVINKLESFISAFSSNYSRSHIILKLSEITILFGLVNKFVGEDRDFSYDDFPYTSEYAEKSFNYLKILIREFTHLESSHKRRFIVNVLLLCATHNKKYFWSSETSVNLSAEVLKELLECTKHKTLSELLCDVNFYPTIFKEVLKRMRQSLLKDSWMLNPSSCHMFFWFLSNVKHPHLVDYLGDVFPPPFMFISYFGVIQRALGIQCIDHLLQNVPPTLMKLDGKEDVIYHSLYPLIHSKELDVVKILFPCILKLPMMTQKKKLVYWSKYDDVFHQLLVYVEMENNLQLKREYLAHILTFIDLMPPFKYLKRLINIVKSNLTDCEYKDPECQIASLKILRATIQSCWPRMEHYCFEILVTICELNDPEHGTPSEEISHLCEECVILLKHSCREKFQALTENYISEDSDMPGVCLLKSALAKAN